jgi:tRNA (guanosine-2'-O-)-methyltransferase
MGIREAMSKTPFFPFENTITIDERQFTPEQVLQGISSQLVDERKVKLFESVKNRCFDYPIVCENLYDTGNINAIIRSAENFGLANIHIIESIRTKISARTTQGAHKWVEISKWQQGPECFQSLKNQGFQLVATTLSERSHSFYDLDFNKPYALILGNEKDGVSPIAQEMADHHVLIPTVGLSQSFNVSVAAALMMGHWHYEIHHLKKFHSLSCEQKENLKARYFLRSLKNIQHKPNMLANLIEQAL